MPQVTTENAILHSDAINHVALYHSVQAISGTPDNYRTFDRLKYNKAAALGTRGYIQQILRKKNTLIYGADFTDLKSYLETLYATSPKRETTHAIMDVCATFRGKPNVEVAKALANSSFCATKIKYVLFFQTLKINNQENDVLHAYDIKNKKIIRLNNTDPQEVDQALHCGPDERFTYYDQIHTTGVDLKQPQQSNGLCLVDEKTKEFFQGAYRMRGLAEQQTIEIITPTKMANTTLDYLMQTMEDNEENALKEDNFYATLAKLNNVVREQALRYIAHVPHKEQEKQKEEETECYGKTLKEFQYIPWTAKNIHSNINVYKVNEIDTSKFEQKKDKKSETKTVSDKLADFSSAVADDEYSDEKTKILFHPVETSSKTITTMVLKAYLLDYEKHCKKGFQFHVRNSPTISHLKVLLKKKETEKNESVTWVEFAKAAKDILTKPRENGKQVGKQKLIDALVLEFDKSVAQRFECK